MKKTHVELWAFDGKGKQVASGLVTPAGVCGARSKILPAYYGSSRRTIYTGNFGYIVTDNTEAEWKARVKVQYRAVRFQRVLVDF